MPDNTSPNDIHDRPSSGAELAGQIRHAAGRREKTRDLRPLIRLWPYLKRQTADLALMLVFLVVSATTTPGRGRAASGSG